MKNWASRAQLRTPEIVPINALFELMTPISLTLVHSNCHAKLTSNCQKGISGSYE